MPYVINKQCSEQEIAAALAACPYGCIYPNKHAFLGQPAYMIDSEQCTDCGACALACPSGAIAPAAEFGRYGEIPTYRLGGARDSRISIGPAAAPAKTPTLKVIMNEFTDAFVASHVYTNGVARNPETGVTPAAGPEEMPASEVIMNEWIDTFVASHV
jgi:NAD-dependent dihydropyrimidine dehydrogenase PreA subunit